MIPPIGIHPDVPADTYHAWSAASSGRLKNLARSAAHMREECDNPKDATPAMVLGDAAHLCILQPDLFPTRYVVAGTCSARKKDGAACGNGGKWMVGGEWRCGVHVKSDRHASVLDSLTVSHAEAGFVITCVSPSGSVYMGRDDGAKVRIANHAAPAASVRRMLLDGRVDVRADLPPFGNDDPRGVLGQDDYDLCRRMADAAHAHPASRMLLESRQETELSAVWPCPVTGVICKLRADAVNTPPDGGAGVMADIKTTEDASRESFERTVFTRRYFCQAAHYTSGMAALGRPCDDFCLIAVEKSAPFAVAVYRICDAVLDAGRQEVIRLLHYYRQCEEAGEWPAYSNDIQDIAIPAWGMKQLEQVA